jgi:Sel1 repeat
MTRRVRVTMAVAIMLVAQTAPGRSAESEDAGQKAYAAGNYAEARRIWQNAADHGNAQASFRLGLLYDLGRGVPPDQTIAFRDYSIAAQAGLPEAEFNVAVMYDSGVAVSHNADLAALWYARAASRGYPRAEYNLGQLYTAGSGVPRNVALAREWYRAAEATGLEAAGERLATLPRADDALQMTGISAASRKVLAPVLPSAPVGGDTITIHGGTAEAELVWVAPEQAVPVRFYVQVMRNRSGTAQEWFATYNDTSALLVTLPPEPATYAWRVYTVGAGIQSYAASDWSRFTVAFAADATHAAGRPAGP